jgi:hypothetical protein
LPLYPRIYYADKIIVEGIAGDGKINNQKLVSIQGKKIFLYQYRDKLIYFYEKSLPKDHSALIVGMVIGSK